MDEFLKEVYVSIFRKWITYQTSEYYTISESENEAEDALILDSPSAVGKIIFHEECVIELSVTNKKTDEIEYYLHFRMQTLKHAVCLFHEMVDAIETYNKQKSVRILLSCTSGLTTGFFAEELNNAAKSAGKDYHFDAVAYGELTQNGTDYDMILLAPQIGFQEARVAAVFDRTPVATIPSPIFAKYDTSACFAFIEERLGVEKEKEDPMLTMPLKKASTFSDIVLSIGIIYTAHHVHLHYRVYEKQDILTYGDVIKHRLALVDLNDIINMALMSCPKIRIVAIAAPGVTMSGVLTLPSRDIDHVDVVGYLKNLHPTLSFELDNDVNAVACALYAIQNKVQTLSFLMLPRNSASGGIGSLVNGHLIRGYHHIAGEVSYLPLEMSGDKNELAESEQGSLEIVSKTLVSLVSILGPEEIFYYAPNVPEVDEVHEAMSQLIPEEYIPPINKIGNLKEYLLFGELMIVVMRSQLPTTKVAGLKESRS